MDLTPFSSSVFYVLVLVVVLLLSLAPLDASNASFGVVSSEAKVLLHWKSTLWTYTALRSRAPDIDPCMWYGITCVGGKIMANINLPYASLVDKIDFSSLLSTLTHLTFVIMSYGSKPAIRQFATIHAQSLQCIRYRPCEQKLNKFHPLQFCEAYYNLNLY